MRYVRTCRLQAAKRAAANIEGHPEAAEYGRPRLAPLLLGRTGARAPDDGEGRVVALALPSFKVGRYLDGDLPPAECLSVFVEPNGKYGTQDAFHLCSNTYIRPPSV
jgi:hypothetical protein